MDLLALSLDRFMPQGVEKGVGGTILGAASSLRPLIHKYMDKLACIQKKYLFTKLLQVVYFMQIQL